VFGFENQLYSGYRRQRLWAWGTFDRYVEITAQLGATHCVMHGPPRHLVTEEGQLTWAYIENTLALAARARKYGVTYGVENVSYGLIQTVEEARTHTDATGGVIPIVLDVKSAWKRGQKPSSFAAELGDSVAFTHLSFRGGLDGPFGVCLPPSGDEPDLREMFRVFSEAGTMPPVHVVEVFWPRSVDDVAAAVGAVERVMTGSAVRDSER
jgi:sugar phosphate isomerase/epimerase